MDLENPAVKLCVAGTQAEFRGALDEARALYQQAWERGRDVRPKRARGPRSQAQNIPWETETRLQALFLSANVH